ncbi:MAG: AAA family ATPase [Patescibacteria group bacterium]
MIKKILKICGVGRFNDFDSVKNGWNGLLEKVVLLYAENGKGKTTLTSVLRSLRDNNPGIIQQRKSIGSNTGQEVLFEGEGVTFSYTATGWTAPYSDIEIFDTFFVNENIYSGLDITPDHKQQLHRFIVGARGVVLTSEIERCKRDISELMQQNRGFEKDIERITGGLISFRDFLNLKPDLTIDSQLSSAENEFRTSAASNLIHSKQKYLRFEEIKYIPALEDVKNICSTTITSIQKQFLDLVDEHKSKFSNTGEVEEWLKFGLQNITDNNCPFCMQDLKNAGDVLESYRQYFNKEYEELISKIREVASVAGNFSVEKIQSGWERSDAINLELDGFWNQYIQLTPRPKLDISSLVILQKDFDLINTCLKRKISEPLTTQDCSSNLKSIVDGLNKFVGEYNIVVEKHNIQIESIRSKKISDPKLISENIKKIKVIQSRFTTEHIKLCDAALAVLIATKKLNEEKDAKKVELEGYTATILAQYAPKINGYLKKIGTDFMLGQSVNGRYVGASINPVAEYELFLDGELVKFENNGHDICFEQALSEGDKNSLALAFFLARLELDPDLSKKIVVFDDPLTSHDEGRSQRTVEYLSDLVPKVKQLIVLTHNPFFACDMKKAVQRLKLNLNVKTLSISRAHSTNVIQECDFDKEISSDFVKSIYILENYLTNGTQNDDQKRQIASKIRSVIEGYLGYKFMSSLIKANNLGEMIKIIEMKPIDPQFSLFTSNAQELKELNNYSKKYHHDNTNSRSAPINDIELKTYVQQALNLIKM